MFLIIFIIRLYILLYYCYYYLTRKEEWSWALTSDAPFPVTNANSHWRHRIASRDTLTSAVEMNRSVHCDVSQSIRLLIICWSPSSSSSSSVGDLPSSRCRLVTMVTRDPAAGRAPQWAAETRRRRWVTDSTDHRHRDHRHRHHRTPTQRQPTTDTETTDHRAAG